MEKNNSQTTAQAIGNIEIEGVKVPGQERIMELIKKYEDKLGDKTVKSLFYEICEGLRLEKEEMKDGKQQNK